MPSPESFHDRARIRLLERSTDYPPCLRLIELRGDRERADFLADVQMVTGYQIPPVHYWKFEAGWERPWKSARQALMTYYGLSEADLFPEYGAIKRGRKYPDGYKAKRNYKPSNLTTLKAAGAS